MRKAFLVTPVTVLTVIIYFIWILILLFYFSRSSKSPLLSILAPAFVITPRPDVKAVTLALVRGRVPKMPVCLKSLCGWSACESSDDSSSVIVRPKRLIVIFTTNCTWRLKVCISSFEYLFIIKFKSRLFGFLPAYDSKMKILHFKKIIFGLFTSQ